jgi:hypothetical protein
MLGQYLNLKLGREEKAGELSIVRAFILCTVYEILLG